MNPLAEIKYDLTLRPSRYGPFITLTNDEFVGGSFAKFGEYSGVETKLLCGLMKTGDVAIDAGANMGDLTIPLAQKIGPDGMVIAIEPQEVIHMVLQMNVAINELANVVPIWAAVGESPGKFVVPNYTYDKFTNYGVLGRDMWNMAKEGRQVDIITVDGLGLPRLDLLKADVEGMEREVLKGAAETIKKCRPLLFLENDRTGEKFGGLMEDVRALDYEAYWAITPLAYGGNYFENPEDPWPGQCSFNLICVPNERPQEMFKQLPVAKAEDEPGRVSWDLVMKDVSFGS
jgi:FkbM family methyltransferase